MKLLKITAVLCFLTLASCQKGINYQFQSSSIELNFNNMVGSQPLAFTTSYTTPKGEGFTVTKFKYYISNIAFIDSAGYAHQLPDGYFLIDQDKPESRIVHFQIDGDAFSALQFIVGVDSIKNVSGAQTGALDPSQEMFWTWNSGYIMAKLEGNSPLSNLPNNRIEYHIGGFAGPNKALRTILLPFGHVYHTTANTTLSVNVNTDLLAWFSSVHDLRIQATPACTTPGLLASEYADNYARMFSIHSLQSN